MNLSKKQILDKILSLKKFPISVKTKLAIQKLQQMISDIDKKDGKVQ